MMVCVIKFYVYKRSNGPIRVTFTHSTLYDDQIIFVFFLITCRWEGFIMVIAYLLYILLMYNNSYFQDKAAHWLHPERQVDTTDLIGQNNDGQSFYGTQSDTDWASSSVSIELGNADVKHPNSIAGEDKDGWTLSDQSQRKFLCLFPGRHFLG